MSHDAFGLNSEIEKSEAREMKRRLLHDLLSSYADQADVFAEIIQNSYDAIQKADELGLYAEETPRITIYIGRRENAGHYFGVSDNGIGMTTQTAQKFTTPGFSENKSIGKSVGYKGVGSSFFFAASNRITFRTQHQNGQETAAAVLNSLTWIQDPTATEPQIIDSFQPPLKNESSFTGRGTSIFYFFDPAWKPSSLSYIVRKNDDDQREIESWAFFLSSRTALGASAGDKTIEVEFVLDRGDGNISRSMWRMGEWEPSSRRLGYPYPYRVLKVAQAINAIDATPISSKGNHARKHQAVNRRFTSNEILSLVPSIDFDEEELEIVETHLRYVDIFFAYSTDIFKSIGERSGCRASPIRYGIKLIVDGVPQGRPQDFDLTSNQGLGRQAHCVISFDSLSLDVGRKIPANEIVAEVIRKIGVRMMTIVSDYRWALRIKDRPDISTDIDAWVSSINDRSNSSLVAKLFALYEINAPLDVDPDSENDVIYLFACLVSTGLLKGYSVRALSGMARYDGIVNISSDGVSDHNEILSRRDTEGSPEGENKVVEFKHTFSSLLEDFESKKKKPVEIDLCVVWELPDLSVNRGSMIYTYADKEDNRTAFGVTHIWIDENDSTRIPIICLKHVCVILGRTIEQKAGDPGYLSSVYETLLIDDGDKSL
jgi:hypothetical protein